MLRKGATSGHVEGRTNSLPMSCSLNSHPSLKAGQMIVNTRNCLSQLLQKLERIGDAKKERWNPRTQWVFRIILTYLPLLALVLVVGFFSSQSRNSTSLRLKNVSSFQRSSTQKLLTAPQVTLSEFPFTTMYCNVSTDVRGNLGPASVILSNRTEDWIRDRWQAASDMHGTNIQGSHFVQFTWTTNATTSLLSWKRNIRASSPREQRVEQMVVAQRMELDWEAAYSDNFDVQVRNASFAVERSDSSSWTTIFSMRPGKTKSPNRTTTGGTVVVSQWGQSPGVTTPTPLHVLHNIALFDDLATAASQLRILIYTSAMGWGVSLWQVKVYGYYLFSDALDDE